MPQPSLPDQIGSLRISGRLIKSPTDLTDPSDNFGGTVLGDFDQLAWQVEGAAVDITAQENGPLVYQSLENAYGVRVVGRLREWNAAALGAIFPSAAVTTGSTTGYPLLTLDADTMLAQLATDRALKVLLAPDHPDRAPAILMYQAAAQVRQVANVAHSISQEWGFPAIWKALPDASGYIMQVGLMRDLTLSP